MDARHEQYESSQYSQDSDNDMYQSKKSSRQVTSKILSKHSSPGKSRDISF